MMSQAWLLIIVPITEVSIRFSSSQFIRPQQLPGVNCPKSLVMAMMMFIAHFLLAHVSEALSIGIGPISGLPGNLSISPPLAKLVRAQPWFGSSPYGLSAVCQPQWVCPKPLAFPCLGSPRASQQQPLPGWVVGAQRCPQGGAATFHCCCLLI